MEHEDIDDWMRLSDIELSRDGEWAAWTEAPDRGDGRLMVSSTGGDVRYTIPRGQDPAFSGNNRYLLYRIVPQADSVRQMKLDDVASDDLPSDSLGIMALRDGSVEIFANAASFGVSDEAGALALWKWTKKASEELMAPDSTASEEVPES